MKAENTESCVQRDSAEHEEYAQVRSIDNWEVKEADGADLLEKILTRDNLNKAYKRVKSNKGAPGMTVEDAMELAPSHNKLKLINLYFSNHSGGIFLFEAVMAAKM